jgi:hypothetical protein
MASETKIADAYPHGVCPDCGETIPLTACAGEECANCGHVFHEETCDDDRVCA